MSKDDIGDRLPRTLAVIQDGIDRQLHSGCQLFVSHARTVIADGGVGESYPGHPMTAETINLWLSAGKPLTAAAVLRQWQLGTLRLDDPVARFIPGFVVGGKERITIRHVLTHTGGFRTIETGWPDASWSETIRRISAGSVEPDWVVGKTAGYHTTTSWFILGEILARITGREYSQQMSEDVFLPLGMAETSSALTAEQCSRYADRLGWLYAREQGELQVLDWNNASRCAAASPGSNTRGPIRELGLFYEMLLKEGNGINGQWLTPQTVAAMTARHRVGDFDQTLMHVVDFGLGVILDSNRYGVDSVPYGYGRYCSPRTFGHGGSQSSQGWCDPENQLAVAWFFNGRPGEAQHSRRTRQMNEAIYLDLGLAE